MSLDDQFSPGDLDAPDLQPESELDIKEWVFKVLRHWKLITVVVLLSLSFGVVNYVITPKEYKAKAVLQIERRSLAQLTGAQNLWMENFWNLEFYPTQELLLRSRGLAERVVRLEHLLTDPAFGGSPLRQEGSPEADQEAVARMARGIKGGLSVRRIQHTQLVELEYRSDDPKKAARMANAFSEAFIDMGIQDRFATADSASNFLTEQIAGLQRDVADQETRLQTLGRESDIVDLDPTSDVLRQRLQALNQDLGEAQFRRIQLEARYRTMRSAAPERVADSYSEGEVSQQRARVRELEQEYNTKLNIYKEEHPIMQDLALRVDKAVREMKKVVRNNADKALATARAAYTSAQHEETTLKEELENLKNQSLDQKSSRVQLAIIEDEMRSKREQLSRLMQIQSETQVAVSLKESRASNVRIIDTALIPGGPFRPSLRDALSFGLLIGLGLGVGLALLLEFLDRTVKTGEELERILGLPTLAVIPDIFEGGRFYGYGYGYGYGASSQSRKRSRRWRDKSGRGEPKRIELLPHERPRLAVAEAYRSLRTALLLSSAEQLAAIAVTSAEAGEGKTATVVNLAVVMAQLNRKVLIIDGDLRKPRQHQIFKTSNQVGLVNYLTGTAEPGEIIVPLELPNLHLCPSGPCPPNPSELLASERMRTFLAQARQRYDFIILDTPPTLAVTDSTLVGSMADGVVLCCRAGRLLREDARACRDRLRFAEVRTLGAVLNGFKAISNSSSYARKNRYYESYEADVAESRTDSAA